VIEREGERETTRKEEEASAKLLSCPVCCSYHLLSVVGLLVAAAIAGIYGKKIANSTVF
jgi:hypothetical protein